VADFATLVATYTEGFSVIIEPQGSNIPGLYQPSACFFPLFCVHVRIVLFLFYVVWWFEVT
jgi:hypothetical protein